MKSIENENFDNFLLESIEPEVKKAIDKLKKKQALKLQDIMVLLLKSQFNHIQHIDREQTELIKRFNKLEKQFHTFKNDIQQQFHTFKNDIQQQLLTFKNEVHRQLLTSKNENQNQFHSFREEILTKFHEMEVNIYKSQSNLIKWMIGILVGIGLLTKILDKIL